MSPLSSPYTLIMITAALMCISIIAYIWPYRHNNSETIPLIYLLSAITIWVLSALFGLVDQHLVHNLFWAKVEYIGVTSVPLALLRYVASHFEPGESLIKKRLPWLAVLPAIILILAWTNEYHGLIWTSYTPYPENGLVLSQKTYGDAFWVYWIYSYVLVIISTVITIRFALLSAKIFRWQSFFILTGILAPFMGNLLYVLKINPFGDLDLTPLAFSITSISYAIGMFRSNLFDFKPIAQEAAIAGMTDGLLVLDHQGRILDVNPAAEEVLGFDRQALIGKQIEDVFAEWLPDYDLIGHANKQRTDMRIGGKENYRNFEVSDLPFYEKSGIPGGRIVLLHDTTNLKSLEEQLKEMERKHAQALLRQVEDKFAMLYQNMSVGVIYWDMDGKAIDMNPAAESILGIEFSEINDFLSDQSAYKIIREDDSKIFTDTAPDFSVLIKEPLRNEVFGIYFSDEDDYHWVLVNSVPLFKPGQDQPYQVFSTIDDITERKRAEQEIVNLSRFPTENPNPVLRIQIDGRVIYGNKASNELLEMWESEVTGYLPSDLQELISKVVEAGVNKRVDVPCGNKVYSMTFVPVPDSGYVNIYALDVTDRKQTEDRLRESRETLEVILNAVSESILMIDSEGDAIITNETVAQRIGTTPSDMVGKNIFDFLPEELAQDRKKWVELAAREKKVVQFEDMRLGAWVENNIYPVFDEDGDVRRFVIYGRDITSQKQAEKAIQESMLDARQKAETLRVVNQIGQKITAGLELDQLLLALYEECKQLWEINQFYISLYDEDTEMISFPFNYLNGKPDPIASRKNHTVVGFTEYILEHLETLYIPDTHLLPEEGWLRRNLNDPTRSYIGVPLMINDRVVGVLSMQSHSPDAYSPEQIQMLELMTTQTAIAIQNAKLFQQANQEIVERKRTEEKLLISNERFSRVFHSSPNPISISRLTNNQLIDMNKAWENITGWNKEDAIGKSALDLDAWVDPLERGRLKTLLAEQGTVHGFEMQMRTRSGKLLNLLMSAEIISLENEPCMLVMSQDITELKQAENMLRHRLTELETLYEGGLILSKTTISQDLAKKMIGLMEKKLEWPHVTIRQLNQEKDRLELLAFSHAPASENEQLMEKRAQSRVLRMDEGFSGWVVLHGEAVRSSDVTNDPRYLELVPGLNSGLYVPIKTGDEVIGVITVESEQPDAFSEEDERLVSTLASQVGAGLDNIKLFENLRRSNERLFQAYDETIQGWSNALDLRDKETEGHTLRVTAMTENLARQMGLPEEQLIHIRRGALLHDIGKMGVPDRILLKPDKLTDEEWVLMRAHPVHAYRLLSQIEFLHPALNIPHYHHEKWDGTGYPDGLKGEEIPLEARIFAIVDVYDALTSDRPYRPGWTREQVARYVREQSGQHFDPAVVDAFMEMVCNEGKVSEGC